MLDDIVEIEQNVKQIKRVLCLWQGERKEWVKLSVDFIDRNGKNLFWYKKDPKRE